MPEFETVSVQEAKLRTLPGRQEQFMNEYIGYIQQLPKGQAGRLHVLEHENPLTIRRWLVTTAKALGTPLIIKRSGSDIYFWREGREDEQPRTKRSYTRRRRPEEEMTVPEQPFKEPEEFEQAVSEQTTVSDAV
jgi:hypothetical protein